MELKEYVTILQKAKAFIIIGTLLVLLIVVGFTLTGKTKYDSTVSVTVNRTADAQQSTVPYYTFDNYYIIQSSGLFADTVVNLMQSPSVVQSIYARTNYSLPAVRTVSQVGKLFTVRKAPPASVTITLRSEDQQQGHDLTQAAVAELQDRAKQLSEKSGSAAFTLVTTAPLTVEVKPFWALNILLAICIGLLATTLLVLGSWYFKSSTKRTS